MSLKDKIVNYFSDKKQTEKEATVDLTGVGSELRNLMRMEEADRITAVFFETYMPDMYSVIPSEKLVSLSFGYNDDMDMVGQMLISCAKAKHQQRVRNSFDADKISEKPYSVMLYNSESKHVVGGLTVYQEGPQFVACVISEKERQRKIQAMKDAKVM